MNEEFRKHGRPIPEREVAEDNLNAVPRSVPRLPAPSKRLAGQTEAGRTDTATPIARFRVASGVAAIAAVLARPPSRRRCGVAGSREERLGSSRSVAIQGNARAAGEGRCRV